MTLGGTDLPGPAERPDEPRLGVDEWVATHGERTGRRSGVLGALERVWELLPPPSRLAVCVVPVAFLPLVMSQDNLFRYALYTLLYGLMGLGLNVVVGYAGLLDLGYVAFVGFGAYGYGLLASTQFHNHWQAEIAIPVVTIATALLGLLVGLPSRRLVGDYLAIVTLFFGQAFVLFVNNANRISFPFVGHADLTGGSNGLANIDSLNLFGYRIHSTTQYFYVLLAAFALVVTALYFANESRTGRAWRALREDPLAAETMTIPVNRLKLLAFAFGAGVAGFTGAIYGSVQTGAFPGDYDIGLLITIYAVVILGGTGSLAGVALGAIIINCAPELLRSEKDAGWLFYGVILITILAKVRPWRWLAVVVGGTIGLGYAAHAIAASAWPRGVHGSASVGGWLGSGLEGWALHPTNPRFIGSISFVILVFAVLGLTMLGGWVRWVAMIPTLYFASFVWENRLVVEPSVTRLILVGVILIVLMNSRPQGLLGTARVEIV